MIAVNAAVVTWRHLWNAIELLPVADDELKKKVLSATLQNFKKTGKALSLTTFAEPHSRLSILTSLLLRFSNNEYNCTSVRRRRSGGYDIACYLIKYYLTKPVAAFQC